MTIQEMKDRKKELGYTNKQISELSGVPLGTVQKIFGGGTSAPRYETINALEKVLKSQESKYVSYKKNENMNTSDMVSDAVNPYRANSLNDINEFGVQNKKDGDYTIEDYLSIPNNIRAELIDGKLYMMAAPKLIHQRITGLLFARLDNYVSSNKGECTTFVAPTDVQIDEDDKTVIEPDIFVVCNRDKLTDERIIGVPDLVIEVLSPSNWQYDLYIKLKKYKNSGVREYWIVMPEQKGVMVYRFEKNDECKVYSFDDKVPVGIWDGKCVIDFKEIYDSIDYMYSL